MDEHESEALSTGLAVMARDLSRQRTTRDTLDLTVGYAVRLLPGCCDASILFTRKREVRCLAAFGELARTSDALQRELGEGPCVDVARRHRECCRVADLASAQDLWPRYAPKALELGVRSIMGFLLFTNDDRENLGALNVYSSTPSVFSGFSERAARLLASHAAVALSSARDTENFRRALLTRQRIGQAVGIVMERLKLTEKGAFELLRSVSQQRNARLRLIADEVVENGLIPVPPGWSPRDHPRVRQGRRRIDIE